MGKIPHYEQLLKEHKEFIQIPNKPSEESNGIVQRYKNPVSLQRMLLYIGGMILTQPRIHWDWRELE